MKLLTTILLIPAILSTTVYADQYCDDAIDRSAPTGRFIISRDSDAVLDVVTRKAWQRCPLGYSISDPGTPKRLDDDTCVQGETYTFTWQAALQAAAELDDTLQWRLPNIKELNTIVESGCAWPAIDNIIFPDTVSQAFWSSTPYTDLLARSVSFDTGRLADSLRSLPLHVRLISDVAQISQPE